MRINGRRRLRALVAASALVSALGVPAAAADDPLDPVLGDPGVALPNLVPDVRLQVWPAQVWDEASQTYVDGPPNLLIDTLVQNLGDVPIQLTVDDPMGPQPIVSQCVSWRADAVCREERVLDGVAIEWGYVEFRADDFTRYELRKLLRNGKPDWSDRGLLRTGGRSTFCLFDYQKARDDALPVGPYATCTGLVQGISPGWFSLYDFSLPGQTMSLEGLADGRYAFVVDIDTRNVLLESTDADNAVVLVIELTDGVTNVVVVEQNVS